MQNATTNTTAVVPFQFNNSQVRAINIGDAHWFVAKDVCAILGLENVTEALRGLDEDERSTLRITEGTSPAGGNPNHNCINESGLYALIFKSRKPEAKAFRKWVTAEVLPALRKTGRYAAQEPTKAAANRRFFAHTDDEGRLTLQELTDEIVVAPKELPRLLCNPAFVLGQTTGEHKARCLELATAASMRVNFGGNVAWELLYGNEHGKRAAMQEIARRTNA